MSCFICQAFSKNSPSNPQLAQECLATPLSRVPFHVFTPSTLGPLLPCYFSSLSLPLSPCFISFPPAPSFLPACSSFQACQSIRGRRVCECQTSQNARGQHKELLWRWGRICLNWICSLSPLVVFIIFFSLSWPVVHPSVAFSTLPHCESHFPLF